MDEEDDSSIINEKEKKEISELDITDINCENTNDLVEMEEEVDFNNKGSNEGKHECNVLFDEKEYVEKEEFKEENIEKFEVNVEAEETKNSINKDLIDEYEEEPEEDIIDIKKVEEESNEDVSEVEKVEEKLEDNEIEISVDEEKTKEENDENSENTNNENNKLISEDVIENETNNQLVDFATKSGIDNDVIYDINNNEDIENDDNNESEEERLVFKETNVASDSELSFNILVEKNILNIKNQLLGAGTNNVYWYLTNSDTELHLSGTVPSAPEYIVGQDNYDKNSVINKTAVAKVVIDNPIHPTNCEAWFSGFENLLEIVDIDNLDTREVINMSKMFFRCSNLTTLDVSNFDTKQVENIQGMFKNCSNLTSLDLSSFILNATVYGYTNNMLANCDNLKHIIISQSVSKKINEVGLTGDWVNTSTGIVYVYDGTHTTIPTNVIGEYGRPLTISFETNDGTVKPDKIVGYGSKIATPTDVIKSGYVIENWYKEVEHTNVWNFGTDVFTEDMTLYANWIYATYIIKYNANGGTISPLEITKTYNTSISLTSPTKTGYNFDRWYTDNNTFLDPYDGTTDLADTQDAEVDIYAKWVLDSNYVEVNFNSNGGSEVPTQAVEKAIGIVTRPSNPTKNGYTFVNWYKESIFNTVWDFDAMIATESITLYAKWKINNVTPIPYHGGGSGGGGGNGSAGGILRKMDPIKGTAILTCDKRKNTLVLDKKFINWIYDQINNIWKMDVIINGVAIPYKYAYATIDYHTYYFDENGKMVTGWVKDVNGDYYAFEWEKTVNEGMMIGGWRLINDKWHYFQANGKLLINSVTPDGYKVDVEGVWVK